MAQGLLILSCGTQKAEPTFVDPKQMQKGNKNNGSSKVPTFEEAFSKVISPKCATCHSSDGKPPALDNWNSVSQRIADIKRTAIDQKTMPKGSPLTIDELAVLNSWINGGAPGPGQNVEPVTEPTPQPPIEPTPNPQPPPVEPNPNPNPEPPPQLTYAMVNEKVFAPRCYSCHDPSDETLLQNYENVVSNIQLIQKRVFEDKRRPMPPKDKGPLTEEQAALLRDWINSGTPEK